jgi:hypothetical protein
MNSGLSVYNDSDGIHDNLWAWSLERRVAADHKIVVDLAQYASSAPKGSIFSDGHDHAYLNNFRAGGQLRLAPAVYLPSWEAAPTAALTARCGPFSISGSRRHRSIVGLSISRRRANSLGSLRAPSIAVQPV